MLKAILVALFVAAPAVAAPKVARIDFDAAVTAETAKSLINTLEKANEIGVKAIVLVLDSPGGSVPAALDIVKAMENSRAPVICIVDGQAASSGFYILQGCSARFMTRRSTLLAHEPFFVAQEVSLTRAELARLAKRQDIMAKAWVEHAGAKLTIGPRGLAKKIRGQDWEMNWAEALEVKAVDDVLTSVRDFVRSLTEILSRDA